MARRPKTGHREADKIAEQLDQLARFEEFQEKILPWLQEALANGATAEEIYEKATNIAAARAVTIAATSSDQAKALAAVKDILDRTQGKAIERKKVTHTMEDLSDEELEALVLSQLDDEEDLPLQ